MTVGTTTVKQSAYYGHNEVVLYRTRTEILTDKRILLDGVTYTFDQIEAVDVVRLKHHIPFQIMRLIGFIAMFLCIWFTFASFRDSVFISTFIYGAAAVVLGIVTFMSATVIPSHAIRLTVGGKPVYMMYDTGVSYLRQVQEAIQRQMHRHGR
jgi:hypothetical protein